MCVYITKVQLEYPKKKKIILDSAGQYDVCLMHYHCVPS